MLGHFQARKNHVSRALLAIRLARISRQQCPPAPRAFCCYQNSQSRRYANQRKSVAQGQPPTQEWPPAIVHPAQPPKSADPPPWSAFPVSAWGKAGGAPQGKPSGAHPAASGTLSVRAFAEPLSPPPPRERDWLFCASVRRSAVRPSRAQAHHGRDETVVFPAAHVCHCCLLHLPHAGHAARGSVVGAHPPVARAPAGAARFSRGFACSSAIMCGA